MHIKETPFSFSTVEKVDAIREIKNLKKKKAIQDGDIPVKILKENVNFFVEYTCTFYNHAITLFKFSSFLKNGKYNSYFQEMKQKQIGKLSIPNA